MKITLLKNSNGITLVETTIAMGVGLVATLALTTMVANTNKDAERSRRAVETSSKQAIAMQMLADSSKCADRIELKDSSATLRKDHPIAVNLIQKSSVPGQPNQMIIKDQSVDGSSWMSVTINPDSMISSSGTVEKWKTSLQISAARQALNDQGQIAASEKDLVINRKVDLFLTWDNGSKKVTACSSIDASLGTGNPFKNKFVVFGQCASTSCSVPFTYPFTSKPTVFVAPSYYNLGSRGTSKISYSVTTSSLTINVTGNYGRVNYIVIGDAKDESGNAITSGLALDAGTLPVTNPNGMNTGSKWFNVPFASKPFVFVWSNGHSWNDSCSGKCDKDAPTLYSNGIVLSRNVTTGSFQYSMEGRDDDGAPRITGISYLAVGPLRDGAQIDFPTPDSVTLSSEPVTWQQRTVSSNYSTPFNNPPKVMSAITGYYRDIDCGNSSGEMALEIDSGVAGASVKMPGSNGCTKHQVSGANLLVLGQSQ